MKRVSFVLVSLALIPALVSASDDYTRKVKPGGTIKVCIDTPPVFKLIDEDGGVSLEQYAERKEGKCAKVKVPKTVTPGTYTLRASETLGTNSVKVGSVEVVAKKKQKDLEESGDDYTRKVKPGGTIKVCIDTPPVFKLIDEDGGVSLEQYAERKEGKCAKVKVPKTVTPGTYTLRASETLGTNSVKVGSVEVVPKR